MKKSKNRKEILNSNNFPSLKFSFENKSKKIINLINHKKSLELLLSEIKICQIAILSDSGKMIKRFLLSLNENLNKMINEKNSKKATLEKEISEKKSLLQNQIFNDPKGETYKIDNSNNKVNIYNLKSELFLLESINFMALNYINQIDNLILKKSNEYNYIKLCKKYSPEEEKEIICHEGKYYPLVTKLLHKEIINIRKKFKLIVSAKQLQNDQIENTNQNLTELKNFISKKKNGYMENKEIIEEESKEFTQSITLNKLTNNILNMYNNKKQNENEYGDNIIIIDNPDDDESFSSNELSDSSKNEKKKIKVNNNIQQLITINMNINFGLGFDKFYFKDNFEYNSERNNNDIINLFNKYKKRKGLSSTGSLPNILINSIKDKSIGISINENDKNNNYE